MDLCDAIDSFIPEPVREMDKTFLMSVERRLLDSRVVVTVATGRIERGMVRSATPSRSSACVRDIKNTVVTALKCSRRPGRARGDNVGALLRGVEKEDIESGQVLCSPRASTPTPRSRARVKSARKRLVDTRRLQAATTAQFDSAPRNPIPGPPSSWAGPRCCACPATKRHHEIDVMGQSGGMEKGSASPSRVGAPSFGRRG